MKKDDSTVRFAARIRADALRMVHDARASHIGSCLSCADILAVLYGQVLNVDPGFPRSDNRDRFILSKGHAAAILYSALSEKGFFPKKLLDSYCSKGSLLAGHVNHLLPGVEVSTGSLGHGLPIACGMALAGKRGGAGYRVFVLLSDGELDEGATWEAMMFAAQHRLDNIVAIVDCNGIQSMGPVEEIISVEPLADKFRAFRWSVEEIDGHSHLQLLEALEKKPAVDGVPSAIIARTIKGKGVSFMENKMEWHYKSPDKNQLDMALKELGEGV